MNNLHREVIAWNLKKDWVYIVGIVLAFVIFFKNEVDLDTAGFFFLWISMIAGMLMSRIQRLMHIVERLQEKLNK